MLSKEALERQAQRCWRLWLRLMAGLYALNSLCGSKGCEVCAHLALVLLSLLVFCTARRHGVSYLLDLKRSVGYLFSLRPLWPPVPPPAMGCLVGVLKRNLRRNHGERQRALSATVWRMTNSCSVLLRPWRGTPYLGCHAVSRGRDNRDKAGGSAQITQETTSVKGCHLFPNRPHDPPNYQPIIWNSLQFAGALNRKIALHSLTAHYVPPLYHRTCSTVSGTRRYSCERKPALCC